MTITHVLHTIRRSRCFARTALAALGLGIVTAAAASATTIQINLPTFTVAPGMTVDIPLTGSLAPAGLGIYSIDMRMPLDPAVVQSSQMLSDGYLQTWGPAFVNANTSFVAAAAAGGSPATSTLPLLGTVRLVIKPGAVPGTDMLLTLDHCWFNEGSPAAAVTNGLLRIRLPGLAVDDAALAAFALSPASPSPARGGTQLSFTLPQGAGRTRLAIYAVDGRRVRTLEDGVLAAGRHTSAWDLRDASGGAVPAGLYFARLESGTRKADRRVVVVR